MTPGLTIVVDGTENLFRRYLLPLAYQHIGVLHAVLGLVACHLRSSKRDMRKATEADALSHRVAALRSLGSLLAQEEVQGLKAAEEEAVLAMILLLIFHDVRRPPAAPPPPASPSAELPKAWYAETCKTDLRDGSINAWDPLEWGELPVPEDRIWLEPIQQIRLDTVLLGSPILVSTEASCFTIHLI